MNIFSEVYRDIYEDEMAQALWDIVQNDGGFRTIMDGVDADTVLPELEEALYNLRAIAENEYNFDFYRVLWNVLQAIADVAMNYREV